MVGWQALPRNFRGSDSSGSLALVHLERVLQLNSISADTFDWNEVLDLRGGVPRCLHRSCPV
jgi:hypothetical protein